MLRARFAGVLVPDWRNAEDYAFTENLGPKGWAWEFLRRNPEYRRAWDEALTRWRGLQKEGDEGDKTSTGWQAILGEEDAARALAQSWLSPMIPPVWDPLDPAFRFGGKILTEEFREAYGLTGLVNPDTDRPKTIPLRQQLSIRLLGPPDSPEPMIVPTDSGPKLGFVKRADLERLAPNVAPDAIPYRTDVELDAGEVLARFNLRYALTPQLRRFEKLLKAVQVQYHEYHDTRPTQKRHEQDKWPGYLRALDARESGASYKEMADVFFPLEDPNSATYPDKQVDNLLQQARRMLEPEQYLKILLP